MNWNWETIACIVVIYLAIGLIVSWIGRMAKEHEEDDDVELYSTLFWLWPVVLVILIVAAMFVLPGTIISMVKKP